MSAMLGQRERRSCAGGSDVDSEFIAMAAACSDESPANMPRGILRLQQKPLLAAEEIPLCMVNGAPRVNLSLRICWRAQARSAKRSGQLVRTA